MRKSKRGFTQLVDFAEVASPRTKGASPKFTTGFTLMEILMVMAILGFIAAFGLFVSLDFLKTHSFKSEREIIVSVLEKARGRAMSNINDAVGHGVHFNGTQYIVFECYPWLPPPNTPPCALFDTDADHSFDQIFEASSSVSITKPDLPFDIIFNRLSGDAVLSKKITISDGTAHTYDYINVAGNGQIDW